MYRLWIYALVVWGMTLCAVAQVDAERIHRENVGAVVIVTGKHIGGGATVQGSGVCVDQRGYVLATAHQVAGVERFEGRLADGQRFGLEVVAVDATREFALLRANMKLPVATRIGDASQLANGAPLVSIAAPLNLEFSTVTGTVASTARELNGEPVIQANLTATHGSSGGPVFDRNGLLIGVVRGELEEAEFTLIAPINSAYPMLRKFGILGDGVRGTEEEVLVPVPGVSEKELRAVLAYNRGVASADATEKASAYRTATTLLPEFFEAWFNLGVVRTQLNDIPGAEEAYLIATRLRPDKVESQRNLGRVLRKKGDLKAAAQAFERARELAPDDPQSCNDLGVIYRQLEDYDAAVRVLRQAVEIAPDYAAARFNLGLALAASGDAGGAIVQFDNYLQLAPDASDADQVRASIAQLQDEIEKEGS